MLLCPAWGRDAWPSWGPAHPWSRSPPRSLCTPPASAPTPCWPSIAHCIPFQYTVYGACYCVQYCTNTWLFDPSEHRIRIRQRIRQKRRQRSSLLFGGQTHLAARIISQIWIKYFERISILGGWWFGLVWTGWSSMPPSLRSSINPFHQLILGLNL